MTPNEYKEKRQRLEKRLAQLTEQVRRDEEYAKVYDTKERLRFEKLRTDFFAKIGKRYFESADLLKISESDCKEQGDIYFTNLYDLFFFLTTDK